MAVAEPLILTLFECDYLGTNDEVLSRNTRLHRREPIYPDCDHCLLGGFGGGCTYDLKIENGYQRTVPLCGETTYGPVKSHIVRLLGDGNGFHPTLCASRGVFFFPSGLQSRSVVLNALYKRGITTWIDVEFLSDNRTLIISAKHPSTDLIEFNILPHNNGIDIQILTVAK
jgi:hypothetical protein